MSQQPHAAAVPSRPTLADYYLVLAGFSLSLLLIRLSPWTLKEPDGLSVPVREVVAQLGDVMRLTEGIVLLWPLFLALQSLRGRAQSLTAAEWLWVIAWLCVVLLTGLAAWKRWGTLPEWIQDLGDKPRTIYYTIVAPSMGVLALVFTLGGLLSRGPAPWTHPFSLALVTWPVLPLAAILTFGK